MEDDSVTRATRRFPYGDAQGQATLVDRITYSSGRSLRTLRAYGHAVAVAVHYQNASRNRSAQEVTVFFATEPGRIEKWT